MKGNRKELSVWKMGVISCRWSTIFFNIKNFFKNIKFAVQRARYGYCKGDLWNLDYYLLVLLRECLYSFADTTHTFPFDRGSHEKWQEEVRKAAEDFHYSLTESYDNPYFEKYFEAMEKGDVADYTTLLGKSRERDEEIARLAKEHRQRAFEWVIKNFDNLWD